LDALPAIPVGFEPATHSLEEVRLRNGYLPFQTDTTRVCALTTKGFFRLSELEALHPGLKKEESPGGAGHTARFAKPALAASKG
jgi:hypothetical protein